MKQQFEHTERIPYESKHAFILLSIILMGLFVLGIILEGYQEKPETRKIDSAFSYRGHIVNGLPVNINDHCIEYE